MSATWVDPIFTSLTASAYKAALDGDHAIAKRLVNAFNCHQQTVADLTVRADAGALLVAGALFEIAAQTVSGFVATSANTRIDRIVLDPYTGVATRVAGTQASVPVAPAIPAGKIPLFRVGPFTTTTTQIPNSFLTDERLLGLPTEIGGIATLTDAATINWDATFPVAQVTLGGNRTLANPTNLVDGRRYTLWIIQDSTGGRTITFGSNYLFPLGIDTSLLDPAALAENILEGTAKGGKLSCSLGRGMS